MARSLSGLTTRGRCLLAAGVAAAACAIVLNERGLLRIAIFVIVLPLLFAVLVGLGRVRIAARRVLRPPRVTAGESGEVELALWRTGRLPAGEILLEDGVGQGLGTRPRFVVEQLPYHRTVSLRYPVRPVVRGHHQLGPLRATITDPFGLTEFERELHGNTRLVAVPRVEALTGNPSGAGTGGDEDGNVRLHAGQGEPDVIVRQYRQGDDLRKVHWRSTARKDEIMVRVEERPWRGGTTVLLDHRTAAHHGSGAASSIEWAVSFAASACLHLRRTGHDVRLVSEHGTPVANLACDGGTAHDDLLLDSLAALQPTHQREITAAGDVGGGQELIAVLGTVGTESVHQLTHGRAHGLRSIAVVLDSAAWAGESARSRRIPTAHESAELLRAAGWITVVVGPDSTIPRVWTDLCTAAGAHGSPLPGGR